MTTVHSHTAANLQTWSNYEWTEGLQIDALQGLDRLSVRTVNSVYDIIVVNPLTAQVLVRGGNFFPEHTPVVLAGSSLGGSFLKLYGIYVGFRIEFHMDAGPIITTPVRSIAMSVEESDARPRERPELRVIG